MGLENRQMESRQRKALEYLERKQMHKEIKRLTSLVYFVGSVSCISLGLVLGFMGVGLCW